MAHEPSVIRPDSPDWPMPLAEMSNDERPARFWAIGNSEILRKPLLALFCSKRCPGDAILQTYDLARGLRDAGVPVIGGFHSSMETECRDLLLRGQQPVVICPARGIVQMRIPAPWRNALAENRLLVISPFESQYRRTTVALAEQRNRFVAAIAAEIFVAHAEPGSKTEQLGREIIESGKRIWLLEGSPNQDLCDRGATPISVDDLVAQVSRALA